MVLTFDDGTRDFVDNALPVLQELDITATLFIVAGKVGGRRDWDPLHGDPLAPVPLLDSDELRHLRAQGFTIGSHTYSHRWLPASSARGHSGPGLSASQARREVLLSREVLSALIGEPVRWFAYPYLGADSRGYELVREAGYRGACGGPNRKHERYYLNRIDATAYPLPKLRLRCNGLFHIARQLYRETRYATAD
jgi:peptidoglycan/xylan/chitin deacetylase (PgdA/CDA1 family)